MPWRLRLFMTLDWLDHRVLQHRYYRLCQFIGTSPIWSMATDEQGEAHRRRLGIPKRDEETTP